MRAADGDPGDCLDHADAESRGDVLHSGYRVRRDGIAQLYRLAELPTGLSMTSGSGAITGTPTVASAATTYTVTVTDANNATAAATFVLTVNGAVTATQAIASTMLTRNHAATSFTPVTGSGGTGPLAYSVLPSLPTGLNMASGTGAITGTPAWRVRPRPTR